MAALFYGSSPRNVAGRTKYRVAGVPTERDDLQLLAMFHYAIGAMAAMVSVVPALHLFVATSLTPAGAPVDALLVRLWGERGAAFAAGFLFVLASALGGLLIASGVNLVRRRNYRFCLFAALVGCLFIPFGTLLGVVTVSLLQRPAARALFAS